MLNSFLRRKKDMKYNDGIIKWSKIATVLFIAIVVVADIFGVPIAEYVSYTYAERSDDFALAVIGAVWYLGTVGAYAILISVYKLLSNMSKDVVFDRANTGLMNVIAIALIGIGAVCAVGGIAWIGSCFLTIMALFMALIVLCVRVVFEKAIVMKEEMDLTI